MPSGGRSSRSSWSRPWPRSCCSPRPPRLRPILAPRRVPPCAEGAAGRALVGDRTIGAERPIRPTEVLTVLDEQGVDGDPEPFVHGRAERGFGLFGSSGTHDA